MDVELTEVLSFCDELLQPAQFNDYCPNGLQVQGKPLIRRIVSGVTACKALLEAASARQADLVLVHHGYFWKGDAPQITGILRERLALLLRNDMNLVAYHLPLDAQPEFGNNRRLADLLGLEITGTLNADS